MELSSKPHVYFEVEKVIGVSSDGTYQVQWAPAWVTSFHLVGCEHLIEEFLQQQSKKNSLQQSEKNTERRGNEGDFYESTYLQRDYEDPESNGDFHQSEDISLESDVRKNNEQTSDFQKQPENIALEKLQENGMRMYMVENPSMVCDTEAHVSMSVEHKDNNDDRAADQTNIVSIKVEEDVQHAPSSPSTFAYNQHSNSHDSKQYDQLSSPHDSKQYYEEIVGQTGETAFHGKNDAYHEFTGEFKTGIPEHKNTGQRCWFTCHICGKGCARKFNLQVHMRTHTGEKPYNCQYCGKAFKTKGHLNRHVQIHTRPKNGYACSLCFKTFAYSEDLQTHICAQNRDGSWG